MLFHSRFRIWYQVSLSIDNEAMVGHDSTLFSKADGLTNTRADLGGIAGGDEVGQSDSRENPDDRHHNHQLHQGEALLRGAQARLALGKVEQQTCLE